MKFQQGSALEKAAGLAAGPHAEQMLSVKLDLTRCDDAGGSVKNKRLPTLCVVITVFSLQSKVGVGGEQAEENEHRVTPPSRDSGGMLSPALSLFQPRTMHAGTPLSFLPGFPKLNSKAFVNLQRQLSQWACSKPTANLDLLFLRS